MKVFAGGLNLNGQTKEFGAQTKKLNCISSTPLHNRTQVKTVVVFLPDLTDSGCQLHSSPSLRNHHLHKQEFESDQNFGTA